MTSQDNVKPSSLLPNTLFLITYPTREEVSIKPILCLWLCIQIAWATRWKKRRSYCRRIKTQRSYQINSINLRDDAVQENTINTILKFQSIECSEKKAFSFVENRIKTLFSSAHDKKIRKLNEPNVVFIVSIDNKCSNQNYIHTVVCSVAVFLAMCINK